MNLSQAADGGIDLAQILGIGGPSSIATALLFWIGKLWLDNRREKREETKTERESESGIVETTSALTKMVREQMLEMSKDMGALKADNVQLREELVRTREEHSVELRRLRAEQEIELDKMRERISGLELDNERLRQARKL